LDEERRDVLALLEGPTARGTRGPASSNTSGRASSPFTNPRSPVRSMLDIDGDVPPKRLSNVATNGGATGSPRVAPIRSMLDIDTPPTAPVRSMLDVSSPPPSTATSKSAQTSPTEANHRAHVASSAQHRSLSDAAARPVAFGPRTSATSVNSNPESAYQFSGYLPSNPGGPVIPKRNTLAGKKTSLPSAMAEVVRGGDFSSFGPRDRGRNSTVGGNGLVAKSRSPHNRLGVRSNSPHLGPDSNLLIMDDGRVIDMNSAYRRLSDANLALSQGGLSSLSGKGSRRRTNSGTTVGSAGSRLEKDYTPMDGEDALLDSSDEDDSDEEHRRGRKKDSRPDPNDNDPESQTLGMGRAKGPRTALSLMAAAEEERKYWPLSMQWIGADMPKGMEIAAQQHEKYKVRSLLEPEITVTTPSGDRIRSSKPGVHPNTSFDEGASGFNTPVDSDTEADLEDVKRAQKLSINMTSIVSTPATSRCVRTIYRGDFGKMQKEAQDNQRRVRKYLVATDLSDEAAHALEWTIGTVLRDGDTLLAIYCVDEELGINNDGSGDDQMKEQAAAIAASTKPSASTPILGPLHSPSPLSLGVRLGSTSSASESPMGRGRSKAEQERYRAVQDITDRVSKLLRKTKLQVKVVIEVIHCKSPKHLITEVIDYISPTLVILGSRGRSALKG
jgi:nucleotide-binding universal stress UspA family protein